MKIIDISREFFSAPRYPGAMKPELIKISERSKGDDCTLSAVKAEVHTGSHGDAPSHFLDSSLDIAEMPLTAYIGSCHVMDCEGCGEIGSAFFDTIPAGARRLLIKNAENRYFTASAGQILKAKGILCIGTDGLSVGRLDNESEAHCSLLSEGIAILENLDLSQVEPGQYFLSAAPLKMAGSDGAPLRAVLLPYAPILDENNQRSAMIEPKKIEAPVQLTPKVLLCFFPDVLQKLEQEGELRIFYTHPTEMGPRHFYHINWGGETLTVVHPGCGASYGALMMERAIAWGAEAILACGGAGVIGEKLPMGALMVPEAAVRDEGTSYHYLPAAPEIQLEPKAVEHLAKTLDLRGCPYVRVKTWTTDGFYRETRERLTQRVAQGCRAVEMECAAFAAIARFREVHYAQLLYSGDSLAGPQWEHRQWMSQTALREEVFRLACQALADWNFLE